MKKLERKFPYQIHLVLGLIWIVVGITFYSGIGLIIWVGGGLLMTIIGILNRKK
jgi:hypothetical protein